MPNVHDFRAIVQGVEQAEARGDHVTAERLLRQALTLQEASVGPNHPDVANILNNLAIVCELNGKLTDAEACYRRAYAIATSSLPANDPFVTTSRENLEQFCTARGIPLKETPPAASSVPRPAASSAPLPAASSAPPPAASSAPPPRPAPSPPAPPKPVAPKAAAPKAAAPPPPRAAPPSLDDFPLRSSSAVPLSPRTLSAPAATGEPSRAPLIAAVLAVLVLLLVGGWYWFALKPSRERTASAPPPSTTAAPPPATAAPATSPVPAEPPPQSQPAAPETAAAAPTPEPEPVAPPTPAAPEPAAPERPAATTAKSSTTVLTAEVCRTLTRTGPWTCAPATGAQDPGVMYFYTRVASPRDTTIEHRWYRDDRLYQRVPLRIRANPSGFRTYSQTRISADRAGKWKVELRSQDGQLLDEKTFAVQ
jgi:hypothetical protein